MAQLARSNIHGMGDILRFALIAFYVDNEKSQLARLEKRIKAPIALA